MDEVGELKLADLEQQLHQLFNEVVRTDDFDLNKSSKLKEILKQDDLNINIQDSFGRTLFMKSLLWIPASLKIIEILLAHRQFNVNIVDKSGNNTLCYLPFAHANTEEIFQIYKQLILKGININNQNKYGQIALAYRMHAVHFSDFDLLQMLITDGSDIFRPDHENMCAYDYAHADDHVREVGWKYLVMMNQHLLKLAMTADYLLILPKDIREYIKLFSL